MMFDKYRYKYDRANDEYKKFLARKEMPSKNQILSEYLTSGIRVSKEIFPDIHRSIETVIHWRKYIVMDKNCVYEDKYFKVINPELPLNCRDDGGWIEVIFT